MPECQILAYVKKRKECDKSSTYFSTRVVTRPSAGISGVAKTLQRGATVPKRKWRNLLWFSWQFLSGDRGLCGIFGQHTGLAGLLSIIVQNSAKCVIYTSHKAV